MVRVKRGNVAKKRRQKYLDLAKGYVGSNSRLSTMAGEQVVQSLNFAYIGRRAVRHRLQTPRGDREGDLVVERRLPRFVPESY